MIFDVLNDLIKGHEKTPSTRFHKTAYVQGESDIFVHLDMKTLRKLAKTYCESLSEREFHQLITHEYHEFRMLAFLILVYRIRDDASLKASLHLYDKYIYFANNWDLVDASSLYIVGRYVYDSKDEQWLMKYVESKNMWVNRVATVSCLYLVRKGEIDLPLRIIEMQLTHPHDLMHKANGWVLREVGKKDRNRLNQFIKKHYASMPRTTLRYAIERHESNIRKEILGGRFQWM